MAASIDDPAVVYKTLEDHFQYFSEPYKQLFNLELDVDEAALGVVAQSYVYDLTRYTEFHEINIPDRARRAAYICKWLMRFRPVLTADKISLESLPLETAHALLLANEAFAMYVAAAILTIDPEKKLTDRMANIFLYTLRYRAPSEDAFILFFANLAGL